MKRTLIIIILACFISAGIFSCGENQEPTQEVLPQIDKTVRYGKANFKYPSLSEDVVAQIPQWSVLDDFTAEVNNLNGSTIVELKAKTERLLARTDSMAVKIPDTLNTNLIASRLMVVRTRTNLLHQQVHRPRLDSAKIANHLDEFNMAVIHFFVQLNEKFQKDAIDQQRRADEEKELEKQKRFLDSVYQAELRDKN